MNYSKDYKVEGHIVRLVKIIQKMVFLKLMKLD